MTVLFSTGQTGIKGNYNNSDGCSKKDQLKKECLVTGRQGVKQAD